MSRFGTRAVAAVLLIGTLLFGFQNCAGSDAGSSNQSSAAPVDQAAVQTQLNTISKLADGMGGAPSGGDPQVAIQALQDAVAALRAIPSSQLPPDLRLRLENLLASLGKLLDQYRAIAVAQVVPPQLNPPTTVNPAPAIACHDRIQREYPNGSLATMCQVHATISGFQCVPCSQGAGCYRCDNGVWHDPNGRTYAY